MFNFASALELLNAGQRSMKSNRNGKQPLPLKSIEVSSHSFAGNSPVDLDWDDLSATDWQVVGTTYRSVIQLDNPTALYPPAPTSLLLKTDGAAHCAGGLAAKWECGVSL
jgi:hypothetical protein